MRSTRNRLEHNSATLRNPLAWNKQAKPSGRVDDEALAKHRHLSFFLLLSIGTHTPGVLQLFLDLGMKQHQTSKHRCKYSLYFLAPARTRPPRGKPCLTTRCHHAATPTKLRKTPTPQRRLSDAGVRSAATTPTGYPRYPLGSNVGTRLAWAIGRDDRIERETRPGRTQESALDPGGHLLFLRRKRGGLICPSVGMFYALIAEAIELTSRGSSQSSPLYL